MFLNGLDLINPQQGILQIHAERLLWILQALEIDFLNVGVP